VIFLFINIIFKNKLEKVTKSFIIKVNKVSKIYLLYINSANKWRFTKLTLLSCIAY